jgi:hypothetical protein
MLFSQMLTNTHKSYKFGRESDNRTTPESDARLERIKQRAAEKGSKKTLGQKLKEQLTPTKIVAAAGVLIVGGVNVAQMSEAQSGLDYYADKEGQVKPEELKPYARKRYIENQKSAESNAIRAVGEEIARELCGNFALSQFTRVVVNKSSGSVIFLTKDLKGEYELDERKAAKHNVYTGDNQTDPAAVEDFGLSVKEKFKDKYSIDVDTSDYGTKIIVRFRLKK